MNLGNTGGKADNMSITMQIKKRNTEHKNMHMGKNLNNDRETVEGRNRERAGARSQERTEGRNRERT